MDNAFEKARAAYGTGAYDDATLEFLSPKLKESWDERIVKDLIGGLMWQRDNLDRLGPHDDNLILPGFCENVGKHLAYLEKQKLEKLIIPEKKNDVRKSIEEVIRVYGKTQGEWIAGYDMDTLVVHLRNAFAALEKQKEEEGYEAIPVESTLEYKLGFKAGKESEKQKKQFWVPTDEQRYALGMVIKHSDSNADSTKVLESLLDDLTKIANPKVAKWKEKQKEQKEPHYTKRNTLFDKCVKNCDPAVIKEVSDEVDEMLEKEQKPAQTVEEKEYVRTLKALIADFLRGKEEVDRDYYQQIYDWLEGRHVEQTPAEWSEEKEKAVDNYADEIIKWEDAHKDWDRQVIRATAYHFFNLQSKQEWSEEDEKMRCNILNALTPNLVYSYGEGTSTGTSMYKYDNEIKWLKSLRPSWKPSKEQMEALLWCTAHLGGADHRVLAELYEHLTKLM